MTVMATSTRELDINTLVLTAYRYAGLVNEMQTAEGPQWDARSAYGRTQLELIVDALAADGIFERSMELYDLVVPAGSSSVELPADTVDIRGQGGLLDEDENQTPLEMLTRERYFGIPTKTDTGTPIQAYVSRGAPMRLFLWPVPDAEVTVRLQRQRLTFDNSSGAATVDLERYWMDFLLHELASRLALGSGVSIERVALLQAKSQAAKNAAKGKSSSQLPNRFVMGHKVPRFHR